VCPSRGAARRPGALVNQILQSLRDGTTKVVDVPSPGSRAGHVLIRTSRTLVSTGTERMLVEFGKANWLEKARQQPDKVKAVVEKIRTDGLLPTVDAVMNKLDQPLPLGYCNIGRALEVGSGVNGINVGDRVVSNGKHAEVVSVPANLCAKVPDSVPDDHAVFTVIGAIALQGIRLTQPTLGEAVVVTGLGLIGLITVQLLRAHGCRVLGIDLDPEKLALARTFDADVVNPGAGGDPIATAHAFSRGRGVDAVIITAATKSSEPVHQAAVMCRKRGRIVLVGVTGLELSRADFYEKELSFQVSCSYGPGRYDPDYEERGLDYPVGFVRWTEQRNFEAVLDMMAAGRLDVAPLISHRFAIGDAQRAYDLITTGAPSHGILLEYPTAEAKSDAAIRNRTVAVPAPAAGARSAGRVVTAVIGAGNYATATLIPAFRDANATLRTVVSNNGVSGVHAAKKFGFQRTTTDTDSVLADAEVNAVVIATRHNTHASLTERALAAGKHVFVEKPLALSVSELERLERAHASARAGSIVMVGFNRRFAPHVQKMRALLAPLAGAKSFIVTVNAGAVPPNHWVHDPQVGGGRIIGEACHFIDLLRFLAGSAITETRTTAMEAPAAGAHNENACITLSFEDGSLGTILYLANGHKSVPKERVEVYASGRILQLDNFRTLRGFGWPGFSRMKLWRQDKGQRACVAAFVKAVEENRPSPIPFDEITEVSRATIEAGEALR
jgi:predicted dehydrogenase/threonine dehydrogenase-like Zn-dependent dehydrogenase